jgi:ribosomal protein S12 methylthiotransferase accessory factor
VGSNGLASGNHLLEAICAGLYEVIERDATSCWQAAQKRGDAPGLVVDQSTIDGPTLRGILDLLDRAGVDAVITWCPTEIGVPTALAHVVDRRRGTGVYKGYGCHLDPEIAMIRAVTEAIQSRTIFVAGARDDLLRPTYEAMKRSDVISAEAFVGEPVAVSARDMPDLSTRSFHGDVGTLVSMLRAAGFEHVLVRALESAQFEVAVTRVLVPGLEPYQFAWVATGARAQRFDPWAHVPR